MSLLSKFDLFRRPGETGAAGPDNRSGMERRLVLRLLTHWRDLCGRRTFPTFDDIDPATIPDMWPHCIVLDRIAAGEEPVLRFVGEAIGRHAPDSLVDSPISAVPSGTLIAHALSYVHQVIEAQIPISRGGQFVNRAGNTVLYRSIVLPMSDDGKAISGLLCAANCREVAAD